MRRLSVETLLDRCDINNYVPLGIEIILKHGPGLPRCQAFNFTTNQGNRLYSLNAANKRVLVSTGFKILSELPEKELQTGYFVGRRLGFIVKAQNEFAPDQKAKEYQSNIARRKPLPSTPRWRLHSGIDHSSTSSLVFVDPLSGYISRLLRQRGAGPLSFARSIRALAAPIPPLQHQMSKVRGYFVGFVSHFRLKTSSIRRV